MSIQYLQLQKNSDSIDIHDIDSPDIKGTVHILNRSQHDIRVIDAPPLQKKDLDLFIKSKAISFFPGNPEDLVFDYVTQKDNKVILITASKRNIEDLWEKAKTKTVFSSFECIQINQDNEKAFYILDEGTVVEVLEYNYGELSKSILLRKSDQLESQLQKLISDNASSPVLYTNNQDLLFSSCNQLTYKMPKGNGLFKSKQPVLFQNRAFRYSLYAVAAVFLTVWLVIANIQNRQQTLEMLEQEGQQLSQLAFKLQDANKAHQILMDQYSKLNEKVPINPYSFFQDLSAALGPNIVIISVNLQDNRFTAEVISDKSLERLENLKTSARFKNVKESSIIPQDNGKDRYTINGIYLKGAANADS